MHFIRALAKKVLHIDTGKLTPYAGGYDYYLEKSRATDARAALTRQQRAGGGSRRAGRSAVVSQPAATARKTKEQKRAEAEARSALSRDKREREERVRRLEREIANLEARQKAIAAEMEAESTYQQPGRPMQLNRELVSVNELLARLTRDWEKAAELAQSAVE